MKNYLILGIFVYLLQNKTVKAKEIAEKFEISLRTAYRYVDAIALSGVPIFSKIGKNGGIGIMNTFSFDDFKKFEDKKIEIIK